MRRAVLLALLASLAFARTAGAAAPPVPLVQGSVVGPRPIRVAATITPPVQTFGSAVTAHVSPSSPDTEARSIRRDLHVVAHFSPVRARRGAAEHASSAAGASFRPTWTWTLQLPHRVSLPCTDRRPRATYFHVFHFRPVAVHVLGTERKGRRTRSAARFPQTSRSCSRLSPREIAYLTSISAVKSCGSTTSRPAARDRTARPPTLVFWLARRAREVVCG